MWQALWLLAAPVMLQQTMQACVGLVDKIFAGALPSEIVVPAIDGLGIGSYIGWFIGIAMAGLGVGGQVLIARGMGAGDRELTHRALGHAITLSVLWGVVVGIALWFLVEPIARSSGLSEQAAIYCRQYVRMLAIAMPFTGIMTVGSMCLHGAGETMRPSLIAFGVNIVNIIVTWVLSGASPRFLGPNPFPFNLHVTGIALGTAIAYAFGAVMTIIVLRRGVKDLILETPQLFIRRDMSRRIIRIGVPNFFEGIAMWAVNLFVLGFIGVIARTAGSNGEPIEGLQGAHIIAIQWEAFSFLPGFAIGTAAGALAGQYLGAGNARMAARVIMVCTVVASVVMGLLGVLFMVAGRPLTAIVSTEPVHLDEVPRLLFICGLVQVFFAITMIIRQGLRGVGDTMWTFLITTISSYGVRLPAAWLLGVYLGYGLTGIWIGLCGEIVIRGMMFSARFLHGGWKTLRV